MLSVPDVKCEGLLIYDLPFKKVMLLSTSLFKDANYD
jgi:hypothetical protein